jgi:hypothetical protein
MNEPKPKRGGRRPNAGQPKKLGGWERKQVSLSKPALAQLQRIHPKLTTAIEIAAQHYEETKLKNGRKQKSFASAQLKPAPINNVKGHPMSNTKKVLLEVIDHIKPDMLHMGRFAPKNGPCGCLAHHYCRQFNVDIDETGFLGINALQVTVWSRLGTR